MKHLKHDTAEAQRRREEKKHGCTHCEDGLQITRHGAFDCPHCNGAGVAVAANVPQLAALHRP